MSYTPIPDLFISELLVEIDDLAELKLTLYLFWALYHQKGTPRYLTVTELQSEGALLAGLPVAAGHSVSEVLQCAIQRAVERHTVLQLNIVSATGETSYLFLNTPQGRSAVNDAKSGALILESAGRVRETHIQRERLTIYALYEQNVGLLTPLISEQLAEASTAYPEEWITEAFTIAVKQNARNWRYISAILERWATRGKS
ncbi:MAG: DnaD domain-containing protein [Anaerolineae bacterium]